MILSEEKLDKLVQECVFQSSRSQGPGGQSVNKVNSRIELRFNVPESKTLSPKEQHAILKKLKNRINNENILYLSEQGSRSQSANKAVLIEKFKSILETEKGT